MICRPAIIPPHYSSVAIGASHFLKVLMLFFLVTSCTATLCGQTALLQRKATYRDIVAGCSYKPDCIEAKTLALFPFDEETSCEARQMRVALFLFGRDLNDPIFGLEAMSLSDCDTTFIPLYYNSGLSALRMGNFKQAEAHFLRGAMSPSNEGKGAFLSAAGAAAYNEGRLDDAASHFRLAYQCDSLKPSPMLLNNLAGIAIEQQKYDEAFQWGQLALSAYDRMTPPQQRSLDDGNFLEISNTNIFIAALRIGDPKKANQYFPKSNLFENEGMSSITKLFLLNDFIRLTGKTDFLKANQKNIADLNLPDSADWVQSNKSKDPLVYLLTPQASSSFTQAHLSEAWMYLAHLFPKEPAEGKILENDSAAFLSSPTALKYWQLALVILLILNVKVIRDWRGMKGAKLSISKKRSELFQRLRSGAWDEATRVELLRLLHSPQSQTLREEIVIESTTLTASQRIVLAEGMNGGYPKDTAAQQDWSPTYVYQLRSEIRQLLKIPGGISFEQWGRENQARTKELLGPAFDAKRFRERTGDRTGNQSSDS